MFKFSHRFTSAIKTHRVWIFWAIPTFIAAFLMMAAFWIEPQSLTIKSLDVQTPSWPEGTAPLRVALLADFHVDKVNMPPKRVREIVERVNTLKPDVVLLAGDYIGEDFFRADANHRVRAYRSDKMNALEEEGMRALGGFTAPMGTFAVIGNHDCWWDCERVREVLTQAKVTILENSAHKIDRPQGAVWLVGIEDSWTQRPDFKSAVAQVPEKAATITIEHNPDLFDEGPARLGLHVAGHTHGGQVRFPFIGAPVTVSRHTEDTIKGWMIANERTLIVTRGLGYSGFPARFGTPPQIMILTIKPGPKAEVREIRP